MLSSASAEYVIKKNNELTHFKINVAPTAAAAAAYVGHAMQTAAANLP